MRLAVALKLGRISNLPTVWSNVLVGMTLAGGALGDRRLPLLLVALSLFYAAGMFLNDAFDRELDARTRPDRPIPAGLAGETEVFAYGFVMLGVGLALLLHVGYVVEPRLTWRPVLAGSVLALAIVAYDRWHKTNPLSPLLMGLCRVMVYLIAAFAIVHVPPAPVYIAAAVLLCYLIGLTYAAKREHFGDIGSIWPLACLGVPLVYGAVLAAGSTLALVLWVAFCAWTAYAFWLLKRRKRGDVPRAIVSLIAGISLLDAVILAGAGASAAALVAVVAFALTLALQRWVTGT